MYEGTDRTRQVEELRNIADSIANFDIDGTANAEEIVRFWESQNPKKPKWFDSFSDKNLLIRFVEEIIA